MKTRSPFLDIQSFELNETAVAVPVVNTLFESPFLSLYEAEDGLVNPEAEDFAEFLHELYDEEFEYSLDKLRNEAAQLIESRVTGEFEDAFAPNSERFLLQHFDPLLSEAHRMVDSFVAEFERRDVNLLTEFEIDATINRYNYTHELSPAFEDFLGKLKKKIGGFAKKAVGLVKRGVKLAGKFALGPILGKLKQLLKPLLMRVIQVAIGRLPAAVQPAARQLAARLFKGRIAQSRRRIAAAQPDTSDAAATASDATDTSAGMGKGDQSDPNMGTDSGASDASGGMSDAGGMGDMGDVGGMGDLGDLGDMGDVSGGTDSGDGSEETEFELIQNEFNANIASLLFAHDELELEYEMATAVAAPRAATTNPYGDLDQARTRFVKRLRTLRQGEDAGPAVQEFIPAILPALKIGVKLVGRARIVGFLAKLLGRLIQKFVGPEQSVALSRAIVDAGLKMIGFELRQEDEAEAAASAVVSTVEETVRRVAALPEYAFEDQQLFEGFVLEAFEQAAAATLPPVLPSEVYRRRPELGEGRSLQGTWVMGPKGNHKRFRKHTRGARVRLSPHKVAAVETFEGVPLGQRLEEQFGIPMGQEFEAAVHLYESLPGAKVSDLARLDESTPGLTPQNWRAQLHPLTPEAASTLLGEADLGREFEDEEIANPLSSRPGQRFYYLEIPGRGPLLSPTLEPGKPETAEVRDPSQVTITLDFPKHEVRVAVYLSEVRAQEMAVKLRKDATAAALVTQLNALVDQGLKKALSGTGRLRLKHKSVTPCKRQRALSKIPKFLLNELAKLLKKHVVKALANYLAKQAQLFIQATEDPADGATILVTIYNLPALQALNSALAGKVKWDDAFRSHGKPSIKVEVKPGNVQ